MNKIANANPHAYKNLFRLVRSVKAKKPGITKDEIRYGLYVTFSDLACGIIDMRPPKNAPVR